MQCYYIKKMVDKKWIVLGDRSGQVLLTSKSTSNNGILPRGSFLTILDGEEKNPLFIIRVEESEQIDLYNPSPLLVDMGYEVQQADRDSKNNIKAYRIYDFSKREDGLIDFIKPLSIARLSTQEEIEIALESKINFGPSVFPSTIYGTRCQKLIDTNGQLIKIKIPQDFYWHQIQISGKTGSGKTVATKYLAQNFIENPININSVQKYGCVLAINVKDTDFLKMDQESNTISQEVLNEWNNLNMVPHGVNNYEIIYSSHKNKEDYLNNGVTGEFLKAVTLKAKKIKPDSLLGIIENLTELASQVLPDIFRYWQDNSRPTETFQDFLTSYEDGIARNNTFNLKDLNGIETQTNLNPNTAAAIFRRLKDANKYFDSTTNNVQEIDAENILEDGKLTVIDVAEDLSFGSIILRYLLSDIMSKKRNNRDLPPILIIIDEVHQFYNSNASKSALGDLDTICRVGRSLNIGVIFSSQNINDVPSGLSSVVNSKFIFKTDEISKKTFGINSEEIASMKQGFCICNIHGLPNIKSIKFPLSAAGV